MNTTLILRFIRRRFELPTLQSIIVRDAAIATHEQKPRGNLNGALAQAFFGEA